MVLIYWPRRDGRLSWPWLAGWLHTEISVQHRELNRYTVAHLSTKRARRRLTSLIEANALTTPDHQKTRLSAWNNCWDVMLTAWCNKPITDYFNRFFQQTTEGFLGRSTTVRRSHVLPLLFLSLFLPPRLWSPRSNVYQKFGPKSGTKDWLRHFDHPTLP